MTARLCREISQVPRATFNENRPVCGLPCTVAVPWFHQVSSKERPEQCPKMIVCEESRRECQSSAVECEKSLVKCSTDALQSDAFTCDPVGLLMAKAWKAAFFKSISALKETLPTYVDGLTDLWKPAQAAGVECDASNGGW